MAAIRIAGTLPANADRKLKNHIQSPAALKAPEAQSFVNFVPLCLKQFCMISLEGAAADL